MISKIGKNHGYVYIKEQGKKVEDINPWWQFEFLRRQLIAFNFGNRTLGTKVAFFEVTAEK